MTAERPTNLKEALNALSNEELKGIISWADSRQVDRGVEPPSSQPGFAPPVPARREGAGIHLRQFPPPPVDRGETAAPPKGFVEEIDDLLASGEGPDHQELVINFENRGMEKAREELAEVGVKSLKRLITRSNLERPKLSDLARPVLQDQGTPEPSQEQLDGFAPQWVQWLAGRIEKGRVPPGNSTALELFSLLHEEDAQAVKVMIGEKLAAAGDTPWASAWRSCLAKKATPVENPVGELKKLDNIPQKTAEGKQPPLLTNKDNRLQKEDVDVLEYLRQSIVPQKKPDVSFDDIGGQNSVVDMMRVIAAELSYPEDFTRWAVKPPRGILLHGQPGTGKTLLAKALANQLNAGFVLASSPNLISVWWGQAEKMVKGLFTIAREEAEKYHGNCILFIDEVDAVALNRRRLTQALDNKLLSILLQEIDGFNEYKGTNVIVVAATNRLIDVDPAFISRMSRIIEVPLPDEVGLVEILEIHFSLAEKEVGRPLREDGIISEKLIRSLVGYSGRDIYDFVQFVLERKGLLQVINRIKGLTSPIPPVSKQDLEEALLIFKEFKTIAKQ